MAETKPEDNGQKKDKEEKKKHGPNIRLSPVTIIIICSVLAFVLLMLLLIMRRAGSYRVIKVEDYSGTIGIERKDKNVDVFKGLQLVADDMVSTGNSSWLAMLIDSDKHIGANSDTTFYVHAKGTGTRGSVNIELVDGSALFQIDHKLNEHSTFDVTTPNATLSVRGTVFSVSYNPETDTTRTSVTEGTVQVTYGEGETKELSAGDSGFISGDEFGDVERPAFIITRMYSRSDYDPASPVSLRFAYTLPGNENRSLWDVENNAASDGNSLLANEAFNLNISYLLPHEDEIRNYVSMYTLDRLNQPAPDLPDGGTDSSGWYLDTFSYGSTDQEDVTEWFPETLNLNLESGNKAFHVTKVIMWTQVFDENIQNGVVGEAYIKELGFGFYGHTD